eukprot:CAMPEP_0195112482 /NCGR_PEP_ID=MMETSP0448-20130528/99252_1 /TAXON_ID=66468 /ORGANISM="Heterocapsa triquestra, Strain CCMP 448" /LENGTH=99 /DNA_ID=CAMNT_0040149339 /DNA_START=40 /DNA_END=335 /DNA_ORIENTATION=+
MASTAVDMPSALAAGALGEFEAASLAAARQLCSAVEAQLAAREAELSRREEAVQQREEAVAAREQALQKAKVAEEPSGGADDLERRLHEQPTPARVRTV